MSAALYSRKVRGAKENSDRNEYFGFSISTTYTDFSSAKWDNNFTVLWNKDKIEIM